MALMALIRPLEVPKGYILVEPNSNPTSVYFTEKGMARIFYSKDGKDITMVFAQRAPLLCIAQP